jgi:hypothetical protein
MRRFYAKLFSLALLPTLLPAFGPVASARQDRASFTAGGRVSPGVGLSISRGEISARVKVESEGAGFAHIIIEGGGKGEDSAIVLPLEVRTNIGYELKYSLLETEGCSPPIRVSIESVRAGGAGVLPLAAEASKPQSVGFARPGSPAQLLSGPRVSAGGTLSARSNALLVVVKFQSEQSQNRGCGWKARIRLSLHPNEIV